MPQKFGKITSVDPKMLKIFETLEKAAPTDATVLILGETGTGKELTARAIHERSKRASKIFCPYNCAAENRELIDSKLFGHGKGSFTGAISDQKGLFEYADGGTVFLDEIGDMPMETQAKILRALEHKEIQPIGSNKTIKVNVRIIAATNKNLEKAITEGTFRKDLFFRLSEISVKLPSLRERENDIQFLFGEMQKEFNEEFGKNVRTIKLSALGILQKWKWPGNIRQFRNVIRETIMMMNDDDTEILAEHLPSQPSVDIVNEGFFGGVSRSHETSGVNNMRADFAQKLPLETMMNNFERDYLKYVIEAARGNKSLAAKILKIDRTTLYEKIKKYSLKFEVRLIEE